MTINNNERIGRAFNILGQALYQYIEKEMKEKFGDRWLEEAGTSVPDNIRNNQSVEDCLKSDVFAALKVIAKQWDKVFKSDKMGSTEKALVEELIPVRHTWAHNTSSPELETDYTHRAVDSMARLLDAISADEDSIKDIHNLRRELVKLLYQEQTRTENRQTSAEEGRIRAKLSELIAEVPFQDASFLWQALTHRSYLYENPREAKDDNEILEFLGDALLNFLSAEYLYRRHHETGSIGSINEGILTVWRSSLVENRQLAQFATKIDLGKWMRLGTGEKKQGGADKEKLLGDTFEALIGAYYLDSGIEAVREFVKPLFDAVADNLTNNIPAFDADDTSASQISLDPKNQLQQWVHANMSPTTPITYKTIREDGPPHDKEFTVQVFVGKQVRGEGKGKSKKEAERQAAETALKNLKK